MTQHKDLKAALNSSIKPDITHVRTPMLNYAARACAYGSAKYQRSNYLRWTGGVPHSEPTAEDFERLRTYLRATVNHVFGTLDRMEKHQANDPDLRDVAGMKSAAYAEDTDATPGAKVGASMLPHLAHACASLNMALAQAVDCGLLPADPGAPWERAERPQSTDRKVNGGRDYMPFGGEYTPEALSGFSAALSKQPGVRATKIDPGRGQIVAVVDVPVEAGDMLKLAPMFPGRNPSCDAWVDPDAMNMGRMQ